MNALRIIFWASAGLVVYAYAVYPVAIWCLSRLFGRPPQAENSADTDLPSVTLLISAYNEESVIERRLENLRALDYPADKLELVVTSDAS